MSDQDELFIEDDNEETQENKYLLFYLGDEEYGVNIAKVQSIEEMQQIIAVPDMPDYVKGVINLRGRVIPVIDMRRKFLMEDREYDDRTCMIISRVGENDAGFIVDTVSEVEEIAENNIAPPPTFKSAEAKKNYISGLGKVGEEVKILLDVSKLVEDEEIEETLKASAV